MRLGSSHVFASKGVKECVVRTTGNEKKHLTVVLSATGDGKNEKLFRFGDNKTVYNIINYLLFVYRRNKYILLSSQKWEYHKQLSS